MNSVERSSETIQYHLGELAVSTDLDNPRRLLPAIKENHKTILDLGCGIGQTFIATGIHEDGSRLLIGIDNEIEPLDYGKQHYEGICFVNAEAERLPIQSQSVDLVISRVTLPYTNIPVSIKEINRILKPGGEIWITLHSVKTLFNPLVTSVKKASLKGVVIRSFFLLNGLIFHCTGRLLPLPKSGSYESFQTNRSIRRVLENNHFEDVKIGRSTHFLVTATKTRQETL